MVTSPCYELRFNDGRPVDTGDGVPHYRTEHEAREAASYYRNGILGVPAPVLLDAPCVRAPDCRICGADIAGDDYIAHFASGEEMCGHLRDNGWFVAADGTVVCTDHAMPPGYGMADVCDEGRIEASRMKTLTAPPTAGPPLDALMGEALARKERLIQQITGTPAEDR